MTTATMLLLLVGAASTIAFTPPEASSRSRRGAADGSKASSSSGSSSYSGSTSGSGAGFGQGSFTGAYPQPNQFQQFVPFDFQAAYRQHMEYLQRMAAQQNAYATNFFGPGNGGNTIDSGYGGFSGSSSGSFSGPGAGRYGAPSGGFGVPQYGFAGPGAFAGHGAFHGNPAGGFAGNQGGYGNNPAGGFAGNQGGYVNNPAGGFANPAANAGDNQGGNQGGYGEESNGGPVGAQAAVNLDVRGGFAEASVVPDLGSRIAEDVPAPSGGNFGVFTSSSSGSSDINGKRTSFKTATVGVNDNGKVTSYTV